MLTRAGIEFQGLIFNSDDTGVLLRDMVPRAPKRKGLQVKFKYWPENLSKIAVWNSTAQQYVELPCTDQRYTRDLSEHHHQVISKFAREQSLLFSSEQERCEARSRLNAKIELFVTARKIVDRRRAQRIVQAKQIRHPLGNERDEMKEGIEGIHLIETIENRAAGDKPTRNPVRQGSRSKTGSKQAPTHDRMPVPKMPSIAIMADPFAEFDRDALLK